MVREAGGAALGLACDVGDEAAVSGVVAQTVAAFGRLDIIYNTPGITVLPTVFQRRMRADAGVDHADVELSLNTQLASTQGAGLPGCRSESG